MKAMRHIKNHRKPRRTWTLWRRRRVLKTLLPILRIMGSVVFSAAVVKWASLIEGRRTDYFSPGGIAGGRGTEGEIVLSKQQQEQLAQVMRENPDKIYIAKTNR